MPVRIVPDRLVVETLRSPGSSRPPTSPRLPPRSTAPGDSPSTDLRPGLEIVPGLVSWPLILSPLILSLRFPEIVAWFVLTFDFYWLYKAVVVTGSVCVAFARMRRTMAADWRTRAFGLADPPAGWPRSTGSCRSSGRGSAELARAGERLAASGGRRELGRLDQ